MKYQYDIAWLNSYYKFFAKHTARHPNRNYSHLGRRAPDVSDGSLTKQTATHWLLHSADGAALLARTGLSVGEAADLVVDAATMRSAKKRDEPMDIIKTIQSVGEHRFIEIVGNYAKQQHPELSRAVAFSKVFPEDSPQGAAIRRAWKISKGGPAQVDDEREDDDDDEVSALDLLQALADKLRARNPSLTFGPRSELQSSQGFF